MEREVTERPYENVPLTRGERKTIREAVNVYVALLCARREPLSTEEAEALAHGLHLRDILAEDYGA